MSKQRATIKTRADGRIELTKVITDNVGPYGWDVEIQVGVRGNEVSILRCKDTISRKTIKLNSNIDGRYFFTPSYSRYEYDVNITNRYVNIL